MTYTISYLLLVIFTFTDLLKGHCQSRACASYEIPNLKLSAGIIQDPSDKFKMASTSGGSGHGGKRTNAGRKHISPFARTSTSTVFFAFCGTRTFTFTEPFCSFLRIRVLIR